MTSLFSFQGAITLPVLSGQGGLSSVSIASPLEFLGIFTGLADHVHILSEKNAIPVFLRELHFLEV